MSRLLLACLCLTFAAALPAADAAKPVLPVAVFANLQAGKKQTVVTYGTSLTEHGPWVPMLKPWFDARYPGLVTVVNSGGSGQNSAWGLANVKAKVVDQHPDLLFIEFAINDAHVKFKLTPETAKDNLDRIVQAAVTGNPQVSIVLQTMNAVLDSGKPQALTNRPQLAAFYANYTGYAAEHRLALVDNYPAWLKLAEGDAKTFLGYAPDGLHPGKPGILAITWPNIEHLLDAADAAAKAPAKAK